MEKREYEVLWSYYYGIGKTTIATIDDIKKLDKKKVIRKIYEVTDNDYNEVWYLIRDNKEKSYILKSKCGNHYASDLMKKYNNNYKFCKITTDLIKMYDTYNYPIVFKISEEQFNSYYEEKSNSNKAFFNNYYFCNKDNTFITIREYRNKVEKESFENEIDAIYWCSNYDITKQEIINSNIRPFNLIDRVFEYNL